MTVPIDLEPGHVAIVADAKVHGAAARVEKRIDVFGRDKGDALLEVARRCLCNAKQWEGRE